MNIAEILQLKFPDIDFSKQVVIQDDGNGTYIAKWDNSLGPKPDQAALDTWALEVAPIKAEQDIRQKRRDEYPAIGDQLDALYRAMDTGIFTKVPEFYDPIKAVKLKHPKPGE